MKTEWTFSWKAYDFHFTKDHKFVATLGQSLSESPGPADGLEAFIRIVPSNDAPQDRSIEQFGDLIITIPLGQQNAEPLAYSVAQVIGEQIAFRNGDFRIEYGFVSCKRVADTPEEEVEIDGKPYSVRLHLEEVVASPEFDSSGISALGKADMGLLSEYNHANRDQNPIRKFLGFFRILESFAYSGGVKGSLKHTLSNNAFLQGHFISLLPDKNFRDYVNRIVDIRHRCAHLKGEIGFGYAANDPAVKSEVLPELQLLQELAYRCIEGAEPELPNTR
jgi:hypothetical protein